MVLVFHISAMHHMKSVPPGTGSFGTQSLYICSSLRKQTEVYVAWFEVHVMKSQ